MYVYIRNLNTTCKVEPEYNMQGWVNHESCPYLSSHQTVSPCSGAAVTCNPAIRHSMHMATLPRRVIYAKNARERTFATELNSTATAMQRRYHRVQMQNPALCSQELGPSRAMSGSAQQEYVFNLGVPTASPVNVGFVSSAQRHRDCLRPQPCLRPLVGAQAASPCNGAVYHPASRHTMLAAALLGNVMPRAEKRARESAAFAFESNAAAISMQHEHQSVRLHQPEAWCPQVLAPSCAMSGRVQHASAVRLSAPMAVDVSFAEKKARRSAAFSFESDEAQSVPLNDPLMCSQGVASSVAMSGCVQHNGLHLLSTVALDSIPHHHHCVRPESCTRSSKGAALPSGWACNADAPCPSNVGNSPLGQIGAALNRLVFCLSSVPAHDGLVEHLSGVAEAQSALIYAMEAPDAANHKDLLLAELHETAKSMTRSILQQLRPAQQRNTQRKSNSDRRLIMALEHSR